MKRYLSTAQFAALTGVPIRTVRERCERGFYRCRKPRGRWQIIASEARRERSPSLPG